MAYIVNKLVQTKPDSITITADLNGWRVGGGTVHPDLAMTGQVPDIVIHDKSSKPEKIILLELTCPWDTLADKAEVRKTLRYERLALDLQEKGLNVLNMPLEVGARGFIHSRNKGVLAVISSLCKVKDYKKFVSTISKISLIGSYKVWLARRSNEWSPGKLVEA